MCDQECVISDTYFPYLSDFVHFWTE